MNASWREYVSGTGPENDSHFHSQHCPPYWEWEWFSFSVVQNSTLSWANEKVRMIIIIDENVLNNYLHFLRIWSCAFRSESTRIVGEKGSAIFSPETEPRQLNTFVNLSLNLFMKLSRKLSQDLKSIQQSLDTCNSILNRETKEQEIQRQYENYCAWVDWLLGADLRVSLKLKS